METKNEFVDFVEHTFALAREIFQHLPKKILYTEFDKADDKIDSEKLAFKTTFIFNLLTMAIKSRDHSDENKRVLTDFLNNTCVPLQEIQQYPDYKSSQGQQRPTPFIEKNYKPLSAWEKAQQMQSG